MPIYSHCEEQSDEAIFYKIATPHFVRLAMTDVVKGGEKWKNI